MQSMADFTFAIKGIYTGITEFFSVKLLPSIVIPVFGVFFGLENPKILQALLILVVFDFITGIISAHVAGEEIKSKSAVRSAFKIAVYGLLVSAGHLTETITPGTTFIKEAVTTFLALTEFISIIENIGKMGFAVPRKLLNQLHKLRDENTQVKQKKTVKITTNPKTKAVETHTVEEKIVETHTVETPPNQPKP